MEKTISSAAPRLRVSGTGGKLVNGVLFNVSWFAILVTQSSSVALAIMVLHLVVHFLVLAKGRAELQLIAIVALVGLTLDQLLFLLGVFNLSGTSALAPLWLSCLWPVFATTLMHAFSSLQGRPFLASVIGAVGGALSYVAGTRLTVVEFDSPFLGPLVIGALWAVLFPLFLRLAAHLGTSSDPLQSWEPSAQKAFD
jgi:Protein of unknown function (DUF2878)